MKPKRGKGAKLWKEEEEAFSQTEGAADKKAQRLERLRHFGKANKKEARAFKLRIRAKERKSIELSHC